MKHGSISFTEEHEANNMLQFLKKSGNYFVTNKYNKDTYTALALNYMRVWYGQQTRQVCGRTIVRVLPIQSRSLVLSMEKKKY